MQQGSIEDRLAIRELVETFAIATTRIDPELWGSTWAEDGAWKLPSLEAPVRGRDTIVETFREKMAYLRMISMTSTSTALVIEADGGRASGQAQCQELIYPKTGGQTVVVGCFEDEYVKRDGRWLFSSRTYTVLNVDPPPTE